MGKKNLSEKFRDTLMGNYALIVVLGLAIIFTIINSTLNRRDREAYESTYGHVKYLEARDIARSSIQITFRKIDTMSVVSPSVFPITGNLDGGSYQVDGIIVNDSTLNLTATGSFFDSSHVVKATVIRRSNLFPSFVFNTSLGIHPSPLSFSMSPTNAIIDGRDHYLSGGLIAGSPDSVPPVACMTSGDSTNVIAGTSHLENLIGTPKVKVYSNIPDPNTFGATFKDIADYIFTNTDPRPSKYKALPGPLGDSAHPVVVYCDGQLSGRDTCGFALNTDGCGILVVRGQLSIGSGKGWKGLIIEFGNCVLNLSASGGGSYVSGGILMGGMPGRNVTS